MSFEEKRTWVYLVIAGAIPPVYLAAVLRPPPGTAVEDTAYVRPLLLAIVAAVVLSVVASIALGVANPRDVDSADERDTGIHHRGDAVGHYVLSVGALVPLALAMAEADQFWIAQSLYVAFVLTAIVSSVVKLVAYRRGL